MEHKEEVTEKNEEKEKAETHISPMEDPRMEFIYHYLSKTMRVKSDKWSKLLSVEDYKVIVVDFLEKTHIDVITFTMGVGSQLVVYDGFPETIKSKLSYFIRKEKTPITAKNLQNILIFGDLAPSPIDELAIWVDQICVPLLSNSKNHVGWPLVVADDVRKHVHKLKNIVYEVRGKIHGQTLLPMPLGVEKVYEEETRIRESAGEDLDIYLKCEIEGTVIKWATQISRVLEEDSSCAFEGGNNPTPDTEFAFWSNRLANLECIYGQLRDLHVKKMASILEITDSAYYPCFKSLFRNVVAAVVEARDINMYLKPLKNQIDAMKAIEYDQIKPYFSPVLCTLCLVWGHSRYYCNASKIVVIIKEICNELIQNGCIFLDPTHLFQGDVDESMTQVSKVIDILEAFRLTFDKYKEDVALYFPEGTEPVPWTFHSQEVFERTNEFLERLKLIETLFSTANEYMKLEKIEIGGLKGRTLSMKIQEIFEEFLHQFAIFGSLTYDPLVPEDTQFIIDYKSFKRTIENLDRKLASVFGQAFDDCHNIESLFKFLHIAGTLLEREIIKNTLKDKYNVIPILLEQELHVTKMLFEEQSHIFRNHKYIQVDKNLPPVAGALVWAQKLKGRISTPIALFKELDNPVTDSAVAHHVIEVYEEIMSLLQTFENHLFNDWAKSVPNHCKENLQKQLLVKDERNSLLQLNFDNMLQAVLREVRYFKLMGKEGIPEEAEKLYDRKDILTDWIYKLHHAIGWYNELRSMTQPVEFELVVEEIEMVDLLIAEIQNKLSWNSSDAIFYIQKVHDLLKCLHFRTHEAQNNVVLINKLMITWSTSPLFGRKENKKENLLQLDDHDERLAKRYSDMQRAGNEILKYIKRNYHLYLDIDEQLVETKKCNENTFQRQEKVVSQNESQKIQVTSQEEQDSENMKIDGHERERERERERKRERENCRKEINGEDEESADKLKDKNKSESDEIEKEEEETELCYEKERAYTNTFHKTKKDNHEKFKKISHSQSLSLHRDIRNTENITSQYNTSNDQICHTQDMETLSPIENDPNLQLFISTQTIEKRQRYAEKWTKYIDYIDDIVMKGLLNAVGCSLHFFMEEMDEGAPSHPLFEIALELHEPDIVFVPSLDLDDSKGFLSKISSLLNDTVVMAELIPRVNAIDGKIASIYNSPRTSEVSSKVPQLDVSSKSQDEIEKISNGNGMDEEGEAYVGEEEEEGEEEEDEDDDDEEEWKSEKEQYINRVSSFAREETKDHCQEIRIQIPAENYRKYIEENTDVCDMKNETLSRVRQAMSEAVKYSNKFEKYSYLWLEDRNEHLQHFLKYGQPLGQEDEPAQEQPEDENSEEKAPGPTLALFKEQIDYYGKLYEEIEEIEIYKILSSWFRVDVRPFKQALLNTVCKWGNLYKQHLAENVVKKLSDLSDFTEKADFELQKPVKEGEYENLVNVIDILYHVRENQAETDHMFEPLKDTIEMLKMYGVEFPEEIYVQLQELPEKWATTKKIAATVRQSLQPLMASEVNVIRKKINYFDVRQSQYRNTFRKLPLFRYDCKDVYDLLDEANQVMSYLEKEMLTLQEQASKFEVNVPDFKLLKMCRREIRMLKILWDYVLIVQHNVDEWQTTPWKRIDVDSIEMECKKYGKELRGLDRDMRGWDAYVSLEATLKNLLTSLRAVTELQNPAIRERHWAQLMEATKVQFVMSDNTILADLLVLNLHNYEEDVKNIVDKAVKETSMEKILRELNGTWSAMDFEYEKHERTGVMILIPQEELIETLEENQVQLQNLMSSKYISYFLQDVAHWQQTLSNADQIIQIWFEVQRTWTHLESIFIGSEDIRNQLPQESAAFDEIDQDFRILLKDMVATPNVLEATSQPNLCEKLEGIQHKLIRCEKALADYLETKRKAFPRFYFISHVDLLDILSNGNQPELVARHLSKLYDSMAKLKFGNPQAVGMFAKDGEYVAFNEPCDCSGKVEEWLNHLTGTMRKTMRYYFEECIIMYEEKAREQWIFDYPAQVALVGTQIWWATEVNIAFSRLEEGYEHAMKDYQKKQISQLNVLITLLCGELTDGIRQKIMTICTIDVHSRDVVAKMIQMKVDSSQAFQWQSQLRHRWDEKLQDCFCNICDAQFRYSHEYLGCTPRLVITPLTDRCYITLTQSLHLVMGGAPAGPAGTGKTETTKDLGRAMGVMVYVFNCSEQMDYKSCGNIYKGLAQTGAWGCFDEFNRISVEVLSVVSVQVKSVLDAVKTKKIVFNFMGEEIHLMPTVGMFITMNPGYAGRTELPENLKTLFRPCAMVVPDFELICEIMLVAEGFQDARLLARKFITLYQLCRELLSKQDHYDWGLRAIKSVLVVAGALKRGDRDRPEDQVLMRALRDFNIPKIVTDDIPIFMGLIGDLFPALDVPRKRDPEFEKLVKQSAVELKLQPEDNFILKIVQLEELLEVRHSVFIVGNAGTGKTMVWRTLFKTYQNQKLKPVYNDLNPKAVTNDELFGIINPATREWKDGLLSVLMRDQANMSGSGPKWIVLDGDIDPMWIESLNSVMDDNKVLTLASNERIALTPVMRLIFEISHLRTATPATVSRAGILYINPQDLGWNPFVTSWIEKRKQQTEKANLIVLFDKYVPSCLEVLRTKMKKITPIAEISHVQMLCYLLDCMLTPTNVPTDCPKEWYEIYFVFACVWAFGSTMFQDQLVDYRAEFSKWWVNEFKVVKFPSEGTVFNYYIDSETKKFVLWNERVREFDLDYDIPLQTTLVDTGETARLRFFLDMLIDKKVPVMLVGAAGSGKTVIISDKLNNLPEDYAVTNVPFNFYTTSEMLQKILEKPLEKKAGRNFAPRGNKIMVYTIDDMNMPEVDAYGTVQPHTLIRQYMDYGHWYDRSKLTLKDIHNCLFVASMNPTSGSFTISPRLQRHFCVFALNYPIGEPLYHIYSTILEQHLSHPNYKFLTTVKKCSSQVVSVALQLHQKMTAVFLPTAVKFHYLFNLRDLSNIFQALLFATPDCLTSESAFIRLWMHEAMRVYGDKLVDENDIESFNRIINDIVRKGFEQINENEVFQKPLVFCHFADGIGESKYLPIRDWKHLQNLLKDAISQYNDLVAAMNLVLFEDAMSHVCRINRIVEGPRGNALLVGVGGSGKQSLSRLAAFISSLEVFQIQLSKGYGINDMKSDLSSLYLRAGLKNVGTVFLMTDAQVANEKFLVLINDMLASGEISDLFADDEVENIVAGMRNEVKTSGLQDTKETCWKFFIEKVRHNMKVMLCFSPVGSTLRVRARKFPAIINCTSINWFHQWPQEALESVSGQFLQDIDVLPEGIRTSVSLFMAYVHTSVNEMSVLYLRNERRYNYTTPKTFLEQISLYSKLLTQKTRELQSRILRLENGLLKLASTEKQVDGLKEVLAVQEIEVNEKNEQADQLIKVVSAEQEKVSLEKAIADAEEAKVRVIEEDVSNKQKICEADLVKAEPALIAAQEALNTLNKNNLTELKSFGSPPDAVVNVVGAVMVLFSQRGKIPKDRGWKSCKMMMGKVDAFLESLLCYDKDNIHHEIVKAVREYLSDPEFNPDHIRSKSFAAAGLCAWVINIIKYNEVYEMVKPKRIALKAANAELAAAREKLKIVTDQIKSLEDKLAILTQEYQEAVARKEHCQREADKTAKTIDLANRLVLGLGSENIRWRESLANFKTSSSKLPGDVLLITAFISYVGCFTRQYRLDLLNKYWLPYISTLKPGIMLTENLDPLILLTDDAQIAKWNNEGLPSDRMSAENATILTNSSRWPLMIDPQLQGLKWIKSKYSENLKVIQLGNKSCLDIIEVSLIQGHIVLIENIGESVDAVLDPLLGRNFIKKGTAIKIGDKEVDFNPNFRLILHTKLANPHYKPEMQAQTTLINFTVTRDGLEEQLLAEVVKAERPDLETLKSELTKQQNDFKITLKELEDDLLHRLASAGEDILSDVALVQNLETTKRTAAEIELKVEEAKETGEQLDVAREQYRSAAARGSLLYFILNDLYKINPIYQFSLKAFSVVFKRAIEKAATGINVMERVSNLLDSITYSVFMYTSRGLFESDKLIFLAQMAIQILLHAEEIEPAQLDFLLRFPSAPNAVSPVEFLSNSCWGAVKVLSTLDDFRNLDHDIESSAKRWRAFVDSQCPEKEKFPQEWKNKTLLERLCMMRCLRPDRMTYAVRNFVEEKLGSKFTESRSPEFAQSYKEMNKSTPVFFILSPGVDPLSDVEKLGRRLGYTSDKGNFHNVSLGQGQEPVAEEALNKASRKGHWVILQNIHLVKNWLPSLEEKMEHCHESSHRKFRLFMSAEPAPEPSCHVIPPGILESSIKITNEPPTGMQANLHKALDNFSQDILEICSKEAEFKAILFSLCYFHAAVAERRKFGPQGWNRIYPFNFGDLTISVNVLYNYLESNNKVPWEDLRYLFGEIMYGGHITDDWDRNLCRTYLEECMKPELIEGDLLFAPGFLAPPNSDYAGYHKYIDDNLPPESPYLYGLHPNAEIGVLTTTSKKLFQTVLELQPRDAGTGSGTTSTKEEKIKQVLEDMYDKIPEEFKISEMMGRVEDRNPYILVAFQECEQMNFLSNEMKKSLKELELGLKGELTISKDMEILMDDLFIDKVPQSWTAKAYSSMLTLGPWFADFLLRLRELDSWTNDFMLPASVWLPGFFNPQSFLTAIMQSTARKNDWPLDRMCLSCDVTKKQKDDFTSPPREGANVHGLFMDGAQWDIKSGGIIDAKLKDLYPAMPVIYIKAITQDKQDLRNLYECPVYKTRIRGNTYVWTFNLKSKQKAAKWTLAGVALLLQV